MIETEGLEVKYISKFLVIIHVGLLHIMNAPQLVYWVLIDSEETIICNYMIK